MTAASEIIEYEIGATLPDARIWWPDYDGDLIDFSTGYTFSGKFGPRSGTGAAIFTLSNSAFTGAAGSGTGFGDNPGTPNLTVVWTNATLGAITIPDRYLFTVTATRVSDSRKRIRTFTVDITGPYFT